jgi:hypothetical protein
MTPPHRSSWLILLATLLWTLSCATPGLLDAQAMPAAILGNWRITRILPTANHACWGPEEAAKLVGSRLRYRQGSMIWQGGEVPVPEALSRTLSRRKFQDEYKVDFADLGIKSDSVTEIDLQHEDADITGATTEVPGDTVVLAGPGRIVVSACGVFYEAVRVSARAGRAGR